MEPSKILAILVLGALACGFIYSIASETKNGETVQRVIGYSLAVVAFATACVIVIVGM